MEKNEYAELMREHDCRLLKLAAEDLDDRELHLVAIFADKFLTAKYRKDEKEGVYAD